MPPRPQSQRLVASQGSSESSPLLRARYSNGYNDPPPRFGGLPPIEPILSSLPSASALTTSTLFQSAPVLQRLTRVEQSAWILTVVLWIYTRSTVAGSDNQWRSGSTWERWRSIEEVREGRRNLERILRACWEEYVETSDVNGPDHVEELLWMNIPLDLNGHKFIRGKLQS